MLVQPSPFERFSLVISNPAQRRGNTALPQSTRPLGTPLCHIDSRFEKPAAHKSDRLPAAKCRTSQFTVSSQTFVVDRAPGDTGSKKKHTPRTIDCRDKQAEVTRLPRPQTAANQAAHSARQPKAPRPGPAAVFHLACPVHKTPRWRAQSSSRYRAARPAQSGRPA